MGDKLQEVESARDAEAFPPETIKRKAVFSLLPAFS
jgi:hypothetical protein